MSRKLFVLPLLLLAAIASAQQPEPGSFNTQTLGEAAARVGDLTKPMSLEVEVKLSGPVQDIGPLVSYLRAHDFVVTGQISDSSGTEKPAKSLSLTGKKSGVFTRDAIDAYEKEIGHLVPKGLNLNWRMSQARLDS